jgi:outer membrane protein assembly factor BamB
MFRSKTRSRPRSRATKIGERLKLTFAQASERRALFTKGWWTKEHGSAVIDVKSGQVVARVGDDAAALVEDAAGGLVGLLVLDDEKHEARLLDAKSGAVRWRRALGGNSDNSAAVIVDDGQLIIATWHRIATGSRLFALDRATGAVRWTADVEQLHVAHSQYFNDVTLALHDGVVTMHGLEAAGCYLQTFDAASGKRRSSQITKTW